ncbi:MAG: hypothetical protein GY828_07455 [Candidatus Gracilibacteria bacterium]|nr:hypothetical protein [Candidatus Gracilibacteria bacterium]
MESYIPQAEEKQFCESLELCGVRKNTEGETMMRLKKKSGDFEEIKLSDVVNKTEYNGKEIERIYSSGHVFLDEDHKKVFLVTTKKGDKIQHQFTGGAPLEDKNKNVIHNVEGGYSFDIEKVRDNARTRTNTRIGVQVTEEYNEKPLVDWALMEMVDENSESYYKLVCLMHFIVKKYEGILSASGKENAVDAQWYPIENLDSVDNIAPNASLVTQKAVEYISNK